MSFNAWPLTCQKCGQPTVYRTKLCPQCRTWYATAPGIPSKCPFCVVAEPEGPGEALESGPVNPDDAEEPW
jgi:hypothetical protein